MEVPRILHDELLHQLEEPQEAHVAQLMAAATVPAGEAGGKSPTVRRARLQLEATEATPLLFRDEPAVFVDVAKLDALLDEEEKAAVDADAHLASRAIISDEGKHLIGLAVPMMLTAMLEMLPDMALSMMIGHTTADEELSAQVLAAFSLSNLVQMLLVGGLIVGLSSAIDTMASQAFGGKRFEELWLFCQAGALVYLFCAPFMIALLCSGTPLLNLLGQDPTIALFAGKLLLCSALMIPPCIAFTVLRSALQAQNIVFPFVLASLVGWTISGSLAYYLAFHTSLQYYGIALASPVCWTIKVLVLLPVVLRNPVFVESWPGWQFKRAVALVGGVARLGVSSVLMSVFQMVGFSTISLFAGLLPNAAIMITANGIFTSVMALSFMPLLGICVAGAIRMGNALGAGQARRARLISMIVVSASLSVASIATGIIAAVATPYAKIFTPNVEATQVATELIHTLLPIVPLLGFMFGIQSVFRACGKQWLCAQFNFLFMFLLGLPLGLVLAIKFDTGIAGLWFGHMAGMATFSVAGVVWLNGLSWEAMAHEAKHNTHLRFEDPEQEPEAASAA